MQEISETNSRSFGKRALHITIAAVMILLLLLTPITTAVPTVTLDSKIPLSRLLNAESAGIAFSENEDGTLTLSAIAASTERYVILSAETAFNTLFIDTTNVTDHLISSSYTRIESPEKAVSISGSPILGGGHMFTYLSPTEGSIKLSLNEGASITVSALRVMNISDYEIRYQRNYLAMGLFILLFGVLVFLEGKIGFFAHAENIFKNFVKSALKIKAKHGAIAFVIRILFASSILAYALLAFVDFSFGIISDGYSLTLWILASVAAGLLIADRALAKEKMKAEATVFTLILILGSAIALTSPIATQITWDDGYHYANTSYSAAFLTNFGKIPMSVYDLACEHYRASDFMSYPDTVLGNILYFNSYDSAALSPTLIPDLLAGLKWYYIFLIPLLPFAAIYYIFIYIAYIPGIVTGFLANLLSADVVKVFLLGKLINVLSYALLIYFAVRKLRAGKYIFSAFALLPICVFLGASYTCDWWINGAAALGMAYFISALQNGGNPMPRRDLIIMICALAFACGPKEIYLFLMTPLLFMPKDRFKSKDAARNIKLLTVGIMAVIAASFIIPMFLSTGAYTDNRGGSDVSASGQIAFILNNPLEYAKICINFMKDYVSLVSMSNHVTMYAWLGTGNAAYSLIAILTLFFCVFTDRGEEDIYRGSGVIRTVGLLTSIIQIVLIITSLYVSFTPVGSPTVGGCQYRYLFPIFPLILYCLSPHSIKNNMSERAKEALVFGLMTFSVIASYYNVYLQQMFI